MAKGGLCLRVDSPYPGESMSSFLSRTAQFYALPTPVLLKELLQGQTWSKEERRDVDLAPSPLLLRRLSETVRDWQPPIEEHQGFMRWTLAQRQRRAYCPTCFQEDLAAGRTPYFRTDWIPVLVTCCWKHDTPLFDWELVRSNGWYYLPKPWLYKAENVDPDRPLFMQRHLGLLAQIGTSAEPVIEIGHRMPVSEVFGILRQLQALMEKPSTAPMPPYEPFRTELGVFRNLAYRLVQFSSRHEDRHKEPPVATVICPPERSDWIAPIPLGSSRRQWKFSDFGIRQTGSINWRRCYLLFTARTLLGMERLKAIFPAVSQAPLSPWRDWWQEWVRPQLGPEQKEALDWFGRNMLPD